MNVLLISHVIKERHKPPANFHGEAKFCDHPIVIQKRESLFEQFIILVHSFVSTFKYRSLDKLTCKVIFIL